MEPTKARMPQPVRVDASGLAPGAIGQTPQDEERPRARQRPAARVEEQVGAVATVEVRAPESHVATERLGSGAPERDEPLLAPLARHAHDATLEIDSRLDETDSLRDPKTRPV